MKTRVRLVNECGLVATADFSNAFGPPPDKCPKH